MEQKTIFEDNIFSLETSGRDYDFVYLIFNKIDKDIEIRVGDMFDYECWNVKANGWAGLLNNELTNEMVFDLESGNYDIVIKGEDENEKSIISF
jgi:hypothetical protein|nr:MAG TPA: hypothetical protein [Caudoviricetes sp.]